jgi:hypothetical protein
MSSINPIHTSCKDCVFSLYDNITQTDCALNYISKYREKNVEILEAYDDQKEFYIINDKKCLGYRENKWFEKFSMENATIEAKIEKFRETNYIDYLMLIDLKNFDGKKFDRLKDAVKSCDIKPKKMIFVRYQSCKIFHFDKIKEFFDNIETNCKWRIQTMVDDSLTNADILHNVVNLNKGYRFVVSINNFTNDINNIINKANSIVYDELDHLTAIRNTDSSAVLFSAPSYRWSIVVQQKSILDDENNYIVI